MNKYNVIYEDLREAITNKLYAKGDRLPSEMQMMKHYGVSRQTVRQALLRLERAKLITKVQGSGSFASFSGFQLQTKQVAVAVYDFQERVFPAILSQLEETLFQNDYVTS